MKAKLTRAAGYSMTEVLVSIFLLSSGVLGMTGLQAAATRTTQQSAYQTMALQLAADMAETVQAVAFDEHVAHLAAPILDLDYTSVPGESLASASTCHFALCGPAEFVASELDEWKVRLATDFPAARIRICRDDNPWGEAGSSYKWECGGSGMLVVKVGWRVKNPDGSYADERASFRPSVIVPVAPD